MRCKVRCEHQTAKPQEVTEHKERFVVCAVRDAVAENAKQLVQCAAVGVGEGWLRAHCEHNKKELQRNEGRACCGKDVDHGREKG